jgi:hypothetical protein
MISPELESLAKVGALKREPPSRQEFDGLVHSGAVRLTDAERADLSLESRFDLAYNAAHALALAALRRMGYRSDNRYLVFQALAHTTGLPSATWRVLSKCHERRNLAEYTGVRSVDARLVSDLIRAAEELVNAVRALPPPDVES